MQMKKTYIKPEISFESFGINSNFASTVSATCAYQADSDGGFTIGGRTIFVPNENGCTYVYGDGTYGICYYVPTGDNNVFQS